MSEKRRPQGRSVHPLVRLSDTSVQCLTRSIELIERITPGNCSHLAGNIRVMLKAVLSEVEPPNATGSPTGAAQQEDAPHD